MSVLSSPKRNAHWAPALAAWVWGALLLGFAVHGFLSPWAHTVYDIYGPAARNWWAGRDLYAPVIKEWDEEPGVRAQTTDYYRYCPLFAVAVTPFALLPDSLGNPLWKVFNCAFFGAGLWVAARRLFQAQSKGQRAALFLLVLPLSLHSMYNGQANLVVVGAILFGLSAVAKCRWNRAAGWLALATLIKGYPLALGLLLAALYPRHFSWRYAAALVLGLLLPFAAQRPQVVLAQTASWGAHLQDSTVLMRERLRSIDKLLEVCHHPISPHTFAVLGLAAGAAVLGLCLLHVRKTRAPREHLVRTLMWFSAWVVLCGPATEASTYGVMAPAIAWALLDAFRTPRAWAVRLLLVTSLILMGPAATDLFGAAVRGVANRYGSQPLGGLLFLTYLLAETVRRYRPSVGRPDRLETPPITVWAGTAWLYEEHLAGNPERMQPEPDLVAAGQKSRMNGFIAPHSPHRLASPDVASGQRQPPVPGRDGPGTVR